MSEANGPLLGHGSSCGVDACLTCYLEGECDRLNAQITEIKTYLEGALLGHRLDRPFAFTRGESADIEGALDLARGRG